MLILENVATPILPLGRMKQTDWIMQREHVCYVENIAVSGGSKTLHQIDAAKNGNVVNKYPKISLTVLRLLTPRSRN